MTTYVVGDIQGCYAPFMELLEQIDFRPDRDRLWAAGDLINRGTDNLSTLRWFYKHRHCVTVVLGNHDLHLLATRSGAGVKGKSDNFEDVLEAPDGELLCDWLQEQPLFHQEGTDVMVHAGIPPCWTLEEARSLAQEVETVLRSDCAHQYFKAMYGNEPSLWSQHLLGLSRWRVVTNYLTRMRYCTPSGRLELKNKGPTPAITHWEGEPLLPWFACPRPAEEQERVFFGHWASIQGNTGSDRLIGLDTGCVWGGALSCFEIETNTLHRQPCAVPKSKQQQKPTPPGKA